MIAIRTEILKAAFEDAETRRKLLADHVTWNEMQKIIKEFAEKKGWKVVQL